MKVEDILTRKGSAVLTARPGETIQMIVKRFIKEGVGALVVSRDGISLDGIVTERDVSHALAAHGKDVHEMPVSALMSIGVVTCSPDDSILSVATTMTERHLRHLPVKQGRRLAGIVSIGDVLKYRLEEMKLEADVLRDIAIASR